MSDRMQDALEEVIPAIKQIIRKVRDEDDGQLKASFQESKQMLLNHRLAVVVQIPNAQVLVCPSNRFGAGLEVSDVHTILDDICNGGVDWELIAAPMCFEVPAGWFPISYLTAMGLPSMRRCAGTLRWPASRKLLAGLAGHP